MNNLEFIATYIHENPGARYKSIIQNLMLFKGMRAVTIAHIGGQYSTYLSSCMTWTNSKTGETRRYRGYKGWLWEKIDPDNRNSGFKLTERGQAYVRL